MGRRLRPAPESSKTNLGRPPQGRPYTLSEFDLRQRGDAAMGRHGDRLRGRLFPYIAASLSLLYLFAASSSLPIPFAASLRRF
jgi:hypothetical protein